MSFPYFLSLLIFSPIIGVIALFFVSKTNVKAVKTVGFVSTLPALVLSLYAFVKYNSVAEETLFSGQANWIQFFWFKQNGSELFAIPYELAIDGLSVVLILLTAIITTLAALAAFNIKKELKGFYILFLILEIGMLGVFAAQNLLLFFIFFELTLIPAFFLIGKWGYFEKERAAFSFLIYNGVGSAILLIVIMVLFAKVGTTNIDLLREVMTNPAVGASSSFKMGLLIALLIAFGIKLPIFPLHSWMLKVHVQAPPAIVMIHAGILLKIGAYGIIRFGMGIFPAEFAKLATLLAILGVINMLYGAFLAFIQTDFKMVLAYSSISHMGIVLIGLAALNEIGIQGAMFQIVSHGLIAALLFYLVNVLYERTGTSLIPNLGGLAKGLPIFSGFLLAAAMASLGLPGMSGFVSEFMAFAGLFGHLPVIAAIGVIGIIMTAVYLLKAVLAMTYGESKREFVGINDLRALEYVPTITLMGIIVLIGVMPNILSGPLQATLELIMIGIGG